MAKKPKQDEPELKRELGLFATTLCGVGIILGAGIYALVGKAAGLSGNMIWLAFLLAALAASTTGLSYAELSSMFPKSSAEYIYTKKAFGKRIGFVIGWMTLFSGIIASAAVALGFGGYFQALFGEYFQVLFGLSSILLVTAITLIILLSAIIFKGIRQSTRIAIAFTLIETAGLFIIIFIGLPYIGTVNYFELPPTLGFGGVFTAAALIFFAFIGFEDMVNLAEEAKNPKKTMPRAVISAIVITTIIYILVGISAVSIMPWDQLAHSNAPLADVAAFALGGEASVVLAVIALFATANTVLLLLIAMSRIAYGMGKAKSLPKMVGKVHPKIKTPWVAIIIVGVVTILFASVGDIGSVASMANFIIFIIFMVINLALIRLRYTMPNEERGFKIPGNIGKFAIVPFVGILISLFLITNIAPKFMLYGVVLIILGFIAEWFFSKE